MCRVASLWILLICCFVSATAFSTEPLEPTVFSIKACGKRGSGFLAKNIPGVSGVALVTALHVVSNCKGVELWRYGCVGEGDERVPDESTDSPDLAWFEDDTVWVWPQLDLAVFSVPNPNPSWIAVPLAASVPGVKWNDTVKIMGIDDFASCPRGGGNVRYVEKVGRLVSHIRQRTEYREVDLGGLGASTTLVVMSSTGGHGISGGAVLDEGGVLIGTYQGGGTTEGRTTWGVVLSATELRRAPSSRTTLGKLPTGKEPRLTQAAINAYSERTDSVQELPTGATASLLLSAFGDFDDDGAYGGTVEPSLYAPALMRRYNWSLGLRFALHLAMGMQKQTFRDPLGSREIEDYSTRLLEVGGTIGSGGRLFQQGPVSLAVALGLRLGFRHLKSVPEADRNVSWPWGPEARIAPCLALTRKWFVCIDGGVSCLRVDDQGYRYQVGETTALPSGSEWHVEGSVGGAITYAFWSEGL